LMVMSLISFVFSANQFSRFAYIPRADWAPFPLIPRL
jgi:hypothetical protein